MKNISQSVTIWKSRIWILGITSGILAFVLLFIRAIGYRSDFYRCERNYERLFKDWEGRSVYRNKIPSFKPDVVFIGASNIEHWDLKHYFPEFKVVNRGIGEQISAQMLLRFYQDVVRLKPKVVVITAGSNDIKNRVPMEFTLEYIERMVRIARDNDIKVILTTVTPVNNTQEGMLKLRPPEVIKELNNQIKNLAEKLRVRVCDFWYLLADHNGLMPYEYSYDGVHLNKKGYKILAEELNTILKDILNEKR